MHILEITIQRQTEKRWPVVIEHSYPDNDLPVRREGYLELDENQLFATVLPQEYGRVLGEALFHGPIRDTLTNAFQQAGNERLRILFQVEDIPLRTLRWERLCAPIDNEWSMLLLNQRTLFVHYLPSLTDRRYSPFGRRDLRALVLVASPDGLKEYGLTHFNAIQTAKNIQQALGEIPCDLLVNNMPEAVGPATPKALARQLTTQHYTLVHFVAHGNFSRISHQTALFFADEENRVQRVDGDQMLDQLKSLQPEHGFPHFVFLGTCDSAAPEAENVMGGLAQRLVRELGIPAVLAMTEQISIDTLQSLTTAFYQRLRAHGEADRALVEAATTIDTRFHDTTVPALYTRLEGRPLFSDDLNRALTPSEIAHGLDRMRELVVQRAPILSDLFEQNARELQITPTASQPLQEIGQLSQETLDISFAALAMDQAAPPYDDRCPFQGLSTFETEDQVFFFGRTTLVQKLVDRIESHPFLALHGPSGSGKSSLLLAGLIPALKAQHPPQERLDILYMTPSSTPCQTLDSLLTTLPQPDLIIVDQFEELFTLCTDLDERTNFIERLHSLYFAIEESGLESLESDDESASSNIRFISSVPELGSDSLSADHEASLQVDPGSDSAPIILLALREDFWDDCETLPLLYPLMQEHEQLIEPMDAVALRSAIEQQASVVGLRFEADLSHTILDDVASEPGAMPLLQYGLRELWQRRHGRWLLTSEYRELGGIRQTIVRKADQIYRRCSGQEQALMKHLMLRLVRLDTNFHDTPRDTRVRARQSELIPSGQSETNVQRLVTHLADESLVVTKREPVTGQDGIEVAHESLITYWARLQDWLHTDRSNLVRRQELSDTVRRWQNQGQDPSLLYRGQQLQSALQLANQQPMLLNQTEHEFLNKSQWRQWLRWATPVSAVLLFVTGFMYFWFAMNEPEIPFEQQLEDQVMSLAWLENQPYVGLLKEGDIVYGENLDQRQTIGDDFVREIIADPADPNGFYALIGYDQPVYVTQSDNGWYTETLTIPITYVTALAFSPTALYIGNDEHSAIYRCEGYPCAEDEWMEIDPGQSPVSLMRWLEQGERLLVGTEEWVWELAEQSGRIPSKFIGNYVHDVVEYQDENRYRLFVGSSGGIALFEDEAKQCFFKEDLTITSMTLFEQTAKPIIVAGTLRGQLLWWYADTDGLCKGNSEENVKKIDLDKGYITSVEFEPNPPNRLWVGTTSGLYVGETEEWLEYYGK